MVNKAAYRTAGFTLSSGLCVAMAALLVFLGLSFLGTEADAAVLGVFLADANDGQGQVPFETDGTAAGTIKVPLPARGVSTYSFYALPGNIAIASYSSNNTYSLDFISRGGAITTWKGCSSCIFQKFVPVGDDLYISVTDSTGINALYKTKGTVASTTLVCQVSASCGVAAQNREPLAVSTVFRANAKDYAVMAGFSGSTYVYSIGPSLFTLAYTYANPEGNVSAPLNWDAQAGNQIIFSSSSASQGSELWATDGTQAGRHPIKNFYPGQTSGMGVNPTQTNQVLSLAGKPLVIGTDPYNGTSLWLTDGTSTGTQRLQIGHDDSYMIYISYGSLSGILGSKLYYLVGNSATGRFSGFGKSLYMVDGSVGPTPQLVKWVYGNTDMMIMPGADITITPSGWIYTTALQVGTPACHIDYPNFVGDGCDEKLYRLNVKTGVVQLVANPLVGDCLNQCDAIMHLTSAGETVLFSASDRTYTAQDGSRHPNAQPWISRGTPATTMKLKDLAPYFVGGSMPYQFVGMR